MVVACSYAFMALSQTILATALSISSIACVGADVYESSAEALSEFLHWH
jgi:hypothetical protein